MALSMRSKLILGFGLGPVFLVLIGWVAYTNTAELVEARTWVAHTHQVLESVNRVETEIVNAETGQRGFVLTGEEQYLAPYTATRQTVESDLKSLADLISDNPEQRPRVQQLTALVSERLSIMDQTIELRRNQGFDAALALVKTDRGRQLVDSIRSLLSAMSAEEQTLLAARNETATQTANNTFNVVIFGTLGSFVALSVIGLALIRSISAPVQQAVYSLASSTAEILAGTSQQAAGMEEQAAAVAETVSTVDEITQTAEQANERVKSVAEAARKAAEIGAAGRRAAQEIVAVIGDVRHGVEATSESITRLAEQAQAIGEIITVVSELADQTNLLALNAAIEASRAGEHGRSFGVVAGEIKGLADQSKKATVQVRQILGDIQKATTAAVTATEMGTKSVGEGIRSVAEADSTIAQLSDTIAEVAQATTQITASAGQQAIGMAQIQQAMHGINAATSQNLASTKQAEATAHDLNNLGARLKRLLDGGATA